MQKKSPGIIIGIDRGASFTDFGVIEADKLIETVSLEKRDWHSITNIFERLAASYQSGHVVFTGSVADMPAGLNKRVRIVAEIDAIGFGGAALAGCRECVVACVGTGTAVVHFKENRTRHVGGTGVGGGTIKGLCSLICGSDDPAVIEAWARKGQAAKLNLTIGDLGYEAISFLGSDVTASNFAAVNSRRNEDLAAAILTLAGETVGIVASLCARQVACADKIVMVGKVAENQYIRHILNRVGQLYRTTFIYPENPGYATVYGAVMKYRHDRETKRKK